MKKYTERQKKAADAPVQVDEVDSCLPRTRVGLTLEDDPDGLHFLLGFHFNTSTHCMNGSTGREIRRTLYWMSFLSWLLRVEEV